MIVSGILRTRKEPEENLSTISATRARPMFRATMARDWFFQILRVICLNEKTASNQWSSKDILAAIRNVFTTVRSYEIVYTPNEHITINGQLVLLRDKLLFYMFIKSKPGK